MCEDVVNNSNETRAKVWLVFVSLPCVISYFQTAHHREGKKIRRKRVIRERLVSVCAHKGMQSKRKRSQNI